MTSPWGPKTMTHQMGEEAVDIEAVAKATGPPAADQTSMPEPRVPVQPTAEALHVGQVATSPLVRDLGGMTPAPELPNGRVAETALTPAKVVRKRPRRSPRGLWHRPTVLFYFQVAAILSAGVSVALVVRADVTTAVVVVLLSVVIKFHGGRAAVRPGFPHPGRMASDMALPFALVSSSVAFAGASTANLRSAAVIIAGITAADVAATLVRRWLQRPLRVIVIGDGAAIVRAVRRWGEDPALRVVGGLLLDDAEDTPPVSTLMGVRTIRGVDEIVEWVGLWAADLVVVTPSPGVRSEYVRQLSWLLEGTDATLAVMGVLDSTAPHRMEATVLATTTMIRVRPSRPSPYIRATKWCIDRVVSVALLLLATPLLGVLWLAIKLESQGPGFFTQTRIGKDGRSFTMYKLRTMRRDAEVVKVALAEADEGNGMLFKMRLDPRITGLGRFLRKTSLDELPQLLNVVLGQMSLVGPRPALPSEVEQYDDVVRRRLTVRPGMTGLWQVSGRSDLSWEQSVDLDLLYTDNYCLADDMRIGLRTVNAVVRARGAY